MPGRTCAAIALLISTTTFAAPLPVPTHIVLVIEENHSRTSIINNPDAPYINSLAAAGSNFSNFSAITHPSQPNYLALFSGSTQDITSNDIPADLPFNTPNLAAALRSVGQSFIGYSEDLPIAGSNIETSDAYVRKHNPWVNWQDDTTPLPPNHLPLSVNQPFSAFPTNFDDLPTLAIIVPNLDNDMHDGSIAQGDAWLESHLSAYNTYAQSHNSLLIITFDEDEGANGNNIPVIFSGPLVKPGYIDPSPWNTYSLLRTLEDMYNAAPSAAAASAPNLSPIFLVPEPTSLAIFAFILLAALCSRPRRRSPARAS